MTEMSGLRRVNNREAQAQKAQTKREKKLN
jgi:hypothetical protein